MQLGGWKVFCFFGQNIQVEFGERSDGVLCATFGACQLLRPVGVTPCCYKGTLSNLLLPYEFFHSKRQVR